MKHLSDKNNMYPKVKVRVEREEADQYDFEKSSLESLKAFEWLSLLLTSSDEPPGPVVRVPRSYVPKTPPPSFYSSKETNRTKKTVAEEGRKQVRSSSAPRPRAVLSSPDNDALIGCRPLTRRELSSGLKDRKSCQNRHVQCTLFPKSAVAESAKTESKTASKTRAAVADSSVRRGRQNRITPSQSPQRSLR